MIASKTLLTALTIGASSAALAQSAATQPPPAPSPADPAGAIDPGTDESDEIVVTAVRGQAQRGAVIGDIPPEVQLSPGDIRSYGVSTVTELLAELAPQTGSGQGRGGETPVVLLNGRRVSNLREIRSLPTEAIARVDILPEEVALKYGYRADQKVVNIVLRRRFRALTTELTGATSTQGGGSRGDGEANLVRIRDGQRLNVDVEYQRSAAIRESQRDITTRGSGLPFATGGNIAGLGGSEIDPALSALLGTPVTVTGVPVVSDPLALGDLTGVANTTDVSRDRTLRPATDALSINAVLARDIGSVAATLNASLEATGSDGLRGRPGTSLLIPATNPYSPFAGMVARYDYPGGADPLRQRVASETAHLGFSLNGMLAKWQWTATGNYDRTGTRTRTDTGYDTSALQARIDAGDPAIDPFGAITPATLGDLTRDTARSIANTGGLDLVVSGSPFDLPAGPVSTTVKFGLDASAFDTRSLRAGKERSADLHRDGADGQINLDLPLTSRRNAVLPFLGDLSANLNAEANRISDFGTLTSIGYGATWKPRTGISLIWSMTHEQGAPTVQQLGDPLVPTQGVRTFDYTTGQTVDVTRIDGGNAALDADNRRVMKLGLTYKPFAKTALSFTANYVRSRIRDAIASLPATTATIEAAFPDRFVRDAAGTLIQIDNRPLNFQSEDRDQLRWGFNFSKPIKSHIVRPQRRPGDGSAPDLRGALGQNGAPGGDRAPDAPRGDGGDRGGSGGPGDGGTGGGGTGGGGFGGRGGNGGRLQFALYHTWIFRDDIRIRDGVPVIDLLNGDAIGSSGGQPRHQLEAQAGVSKNGWGARLSGDWQSGTNVRGGTRGSSDLRFSDLTTLNLRLFANLGQMTLFEGQSWAPGTRVTLGVNNLFDQRIDVRDASGAVPVSYQPGYLDPLGREVRISVRKLF